MGFWLSRVVNYPLVSPDFIQIPLTYRCNLACKMCSIRAQDQGKELSQDDISGIIDQAADMGIRWVVFSGGEPLLRSDLFAICDYCKTKGFRVSVTTNGTVITEELAQRAASSGLSHLHFSLDGLEAANDFIRGKGSFLAASRAVKIINEARGKRNSGLFISIACTIMDHNLKDLCSLLEYADSLNIDVVNFQPLLKDNTNTPNTGDTEFWIRRENLPLLDRTINTLKEFRGKHTKVDAEPDLGLFTKYYRRAVTRHDWRCFSGYKTIFICIGDDNSPLVYACDGICGNLKEKPLRDCWVSPEARRLRRKAAECRTPCLQSCYSRTAADSLLRIMKGFYKTLYA